MEQLRTVWRGCIYTLKVLWKISTIHNKTYKCKVKMTYLIFEKLSRSFSACWKAASNFNSKITCGSYFHARKSPIREKTILGSSVLLRHEKRYIWIIVHFIWGTSQLPATYTKPYDAQWFIHMKYSIILWHWWKTFSIFWPRNEIIIAHGSIWLLSRFS